MLQRDPQNGVVKEEQNKACKNMKGFEEKWINEFNMVKEKAHILCGNKKMKVVVLYQPK